MGKIGLIAFAAFAATVPAFAAAISGSVTSAAPAGGAFFAWTRDIDGNGAALEVFVMELVDGFLGIFGRGVFHEGKSAGFAGDFIHHEIDGCDCAYLCKMILKIILSGLV